MEQLLKRNENENNELVSNVFLGLSGFVLIIWLLAVVGIFEVDFNIISSFAMTLIILLIIPVILIRLIKLRNPLMKYVLVLDVSLVTGVGYIFFTYQMVLMFIIPVLIALLYMNKKVLWFAEIVSLTSLTVSHLLSAKFVAQPWLEIFSKMIDIVRFNLSPRILQLIACYVVINLLIKRVTEYFNEYDRLISETTTIIVSKSNETDSDVVDFVNVLNGFTESEKNVFLELLHGKTNSQIAEELSLSNGTVKNYVSRVYDKLGCRERNYLILKYSAVLSKYDQSHMKL